MDIQCSEVGFSIYSSKQAWFLIYMYLYIDYFNAQMKLWKKTCPICELNPIFEMNKNRLCLISEHVYFKPKRWLEYTRLRHSFCLFLHCQLRKNYFWYFCSVKMTTQSEIISFYSGEKSWYFIAENGINDSFSIFITLAIREKSIRYSSCDKNTCVQTPFWKKKSFMRVFLRNHRGIKQQWNHFLKASEKNATWMHSIKTKLR